MSKYQVAGIFFPRKEDVDDYVVRLRDRSVRGVKITGSDAEFLSELLAWHPDVESKLARPVSHFFVGFNQFGSRCFFLAYNDGSRDDFSFKKCIDALAPVP